MDWFDNIGNIDLENEAVSYFQAYMYILPTPRLSNSPPTDISSSESENSDNDAECDQIQERARLFYSNSLTKSSESADPPSTNHTDTHISESDDPHRNYIEKLFRTGCSCTKNCFQKLESYKDQVYNTLLTLNEFTKSERDIYLLSKLENFEISGDVCRGGKRERQSFKYSFQGIEVCEFTRRNIFEIGRSEYKSLKKHLRENGVTPRKHGLKGKKSNHSYPYEVIENAVKFIKHYAEEYGLPLPAAPHASDNTPPILLPCSESKQCVHSKYMESCRESDRVSVKLTVFKEAWNSCVPHIQFMKPKSDLCKTCYQLREDISSAITEDQKLQNTSKLVEHIELARAEREFYKKCTLDARNELYQVENPIGKCNTPCSSDFENVHYTFDFSQNVTLPHSSQQVGALFFLHPRKVQIFGVCDENFPLQTNYLIDESETIGPDGSRTHGPNSVLSMVHHYLACNSYGEQACHFNADNCVGQNKNKTTLHYLLWRCAAGLHDQIYLHFMIAGHTKCLCDACFGMLKKKYRKSEVYSIQQLADVVENSAKCNKAVTFDKANNQNENQLKWFRWDSHFTKFFKSLRGIGKFHHFRFTHEEPGIVYAKVDINKPEKIISLLKENANLQSMIVEQPEVIEAAGLSQERQNYLKKEILPFVPAKYRDEFNTNISEE